MGYIKVYCRGCGNSFSTQSNRLKHGRGKYCSRKCQYKNQQTVKNERVNLNCLNCDNSFTRPPSKLKRKGGGKYCSRSCRNIHWRGPYNPNWQGGHSNIKYGSNWQASKRATLKRDDNCCAKCGIIKNLHVHHKIPIRLFDDKEFGNGLWNTITLCSLCHRKEESKFKWVSVYGGALQFMAGGYAWQLARNKGLT